MLPHTLDQVVQLDGFRIVYMTIPSPATPLSNLHACPICHQLRLGLMQDNDDEVMLLGYQVHLASQ